MECEPSHIRNMLGPLLSSTSSTIYNAYRVVIASLLGYVLGNWSLFSRQGFNDSLRSLERSTTLNEKPTILYKLKINRILWTFG